MGVEVIEDYFSPEQLSEKKDGVEEDSTCLHEKDIEKLNQELELDNAIKCEGDPTMDANNFLKDFGDEWPAPKKTHDFYFVKFPSFEDPKLNSKTDQLDKDIQNKIVARFQITEAIRWNKLDRANVISQLESLNLEYKRCWTIFEEKRYEMEPLYQALGKLRTARNTNRERGDSLCSSEEELNYIISSLHYRMQHVSKTLVAEKQLLREIKQLEGTREKVIANAAKKEKIYDSQGQIEAIQYCVKDIGVKLDEMRRDKQIINDRIKFLEEQVKEIDKEISRLQKEFRATNQKRIAECKSLNEFRKHRDKGNAYYYQNCSLLKNARDLAIKEDVAALEELSRTEVKKFMSLWSSNKAFRDDYVKRSFPSLDNRKLSRDGRMRNPDEKPMASEVSTASESEAVTKPKEDYKQLSQLEILPIQSAQKEESCELKKSEFTVKDNYMEDEEHTSVLENLPEEQSSSNGIDVAKLKEIKRDEETVKAKLPLEVKKKLAEKAIILPQAVAERKLKEREKKAKKKGVAANNLEKLVSSDRVVVEVANTILNPKAPVPSRRRDQKEITIRSKKPQKGQDSLPKLTIKRTILRSHWLCVAPASLLVAMFLVLGCSCLLLSL